MARKILLADDSVTAQNMGRRILTDAGYEVVTVNNGSAAMKKVAEIKPDLIVLDVYMPGYGGLEICQRVRETPELSRIPILLTVGKLEPFKADDAKRVRADAFVIKPFDASELLAALTKLEDKIVPTKANFTGRFARAVASIDEAKSGKEFGDTDSGWKSRLKIPAPYSKPHNTHADEHSQNPPEAAEEVPATKRENAPTLKETFLEKAAETEKAAKAAEVPAKVDQQEKEKVASILPPEVASALPSDVTPEEIEAITAAAAMLAQHADAVAESEEAAQAEDFSPESVLKKLSEGPEGATFASNAETSDSATASKDASKDQASAPATADKNGEEDVVAALASLAPSSSKAEIADPAEPAAVTVAAAPAIEYSGPRWVAVEVSMAVDDSTSVLDQEMELSYAAFAAADAARMAVVDDRPKKFANEEKAEASAPETPVVEEAPEADVAPAPVEAVAQEESPQVAEVAAAPAPACFATEQAEAATQATAEVSAETSTSEPIPASEAVVEPQQIEQHEQAAQPEEKAAYAVAAAGGSSVVASEATMASSSPSIADAEVQRQNELAAAWANWKQVREGSNCQAESPTISSENASQEMSQTETSSSGFRDFRSEPATTVDTTDVDEEGSEETADGPEDAAEVANIVDSVLADLKPKLMKEIAQKMGKGKKKKKKN